ncbi:MULTISPECIES: efflux RND transporter periplasmic adaptor subunit [Marinobacter]|jgi:HlyD family secretion protein|uniref:Putative RND efflux membrane fusion protein n=1 Tax=Marinobacter excellens LAMA 842 TaxID=1306954 RepID=A0A137S7K2_9GAMM|nr:HlyD family efflux transporter periplasmic adaptor subunit [Marinobacter excellens]KXO08402.1 putative RND efflux membrane fusion protein [Marinobacter excellens LAMA 842]KXO08416.1 putative RND efflux membrane fusion protein [Marinobacter excellens LAMA 842]
MAVRNHITGKRLFWSLMAALTVVTFAFILRPEPVWVDLSTAQRGPLEVTVREEGKTRVKDRYLVSSPVTGFVHRLELDVGDTVIPGELLTLIDPMPASILDARSRAEAEARVAAARSSLQSIRQKAAAAEADADFSQQEYQRLLALRPSSFVSDEQLQQARTTAARAQAILRSARFDEEVASHELAAAQTRLQVSSATANGGKPAERVAVRSPIHGAVLGLVRKSEGIVQAGEPLLELGDPGTLEVVVDVLSFDAVKLEPGLATRLTGWGGPTLNAVIRRVEPVGFQDVSALGVEEQRVKVIADMLSPHEHWQLLGDGYRVDAEFILWQAEDALQVPASALFRHNNGYAVFKVTGDRANIQPVEAGHGNGLSTVILSGLDEGDRVVRHPERGLNDGDRIRVR